MSGILQELVGRRVNVISRSGQSDARDDGVVKAVDGACLVLDKGKEVLVFILANVRLVKVLD